MFLLERFSLSSRRVFCARIRSRESCRGRASVCGFPEGLCLRGVSATQYKVRGVDEDVECVNIEGLLLRGYGRMGRELRWTEDEGFDANLPAPDCPCHEG